MDIPVRHPRSRPKTAAERRPPSPHQFRHLRDQMALIVDSLASSFTTCACGAAAKDCALNLMAAFVDGAPGLPFPSTYDARRHVDDPGGIAAPSVDLGPLVGRERGFRTRERIPWSGGMGGVEMVAPAESAAERGARDRRRRANASRAEQAEAEAEAAGRGGKVNEVARAFREMQAAPRREGVLPPSLKRRKLDQEEQQGRSGKGKERERGEDERPADGEEGQAEPTADAVAEEEMPPRMRKAWIQRNLEVLRAEERSGSGAFVEERDEMAVDPSDSPTGPRAGGYTTSTRLSGLLIVSSLNRRTVRTTTDEPSSASSRPRSPSPPIIVRQTPSPTTHALAPSYLPLPLRFAHDLASAPPALSPSTRLANLSLDVPGSPPAPTPTPR
jgi:uncharacterized protein